MKELKMISRIAADSLARWKMALPQLEQYRLGRGRSCSLLGGKVYKGRTGVR